MSYRLIVFIGLSSCFSFISCDLFKTRTPEEPSQQSSNYVPPTDPSIVLQNMVNAFQDGNVGNYDQSFSGTSFSFTPSTNAQNKYGIDWAAWNKTQEHTYFKNVLNHFNNSPVTLTFDPYTPIPNNAYIPTVETNYHITLPTESGVIRKFSGQVQYTIIQDQSGNWSMQSMDRLYVFLIQHRS